MDIVIYLLMFFALICIGSFIGVCFERIPNIILFGKVKVVEKVVAIISALVIIVLAVLTILGYVQIGTLNREIKEDQKIIAEGRLDELNALKEQYDNLMVL